MHNERITNINKYKKSKKTNLYNVCCWNSVHPESAANQELENRPTSTCLNISWFFFSSDLEKSEVRSFEIITLYILFALFLELTSWINYTGKSKYCGC